MSEVQSRPSAPRGRSSARGGRGGHRGSTRSAKQTNGDRASSNSGDIIADEGELGELKSQYKSQLSTLKELFPDWTEVDLLLGLQDSNGDLESTIERITEGNVSQFSEVHKKTKDRSRSKVKDIPSSAVDSASAARGTRGRGGQDSSRAVRGRGDRGRGGFRGGRGGTHTTTNGARSADGGASVPTTESSAYANNAADEGKPTVPSPSEAPKPTPVPQEPPKKTWASMFATPKPAPAPPKPVVAQPPAVKPTPPPPVVAAEPAPIPEPVVETAQPEPPAAPPIVEEVDVSEPPAPPEVVEPPVEPVKEEVVAPADITPSKDQLTQNNVEHLPDVSKPAPTDTAASTVASGSVAGTVTPLNAQQQSQPPIGRTLGGFATTAFKATATPGRSASYQRRIFEQQEAVVMPGNHAVDRAAVQFGNFNLNGDVDAPLDVDEDREEAETRTQPPQHSPTAQPRTSLPPVPRQPAVPSEAPIPVTEPAVPTPKQAPGLPPPASQQQQQQQQPVGTQQSPQNAIATQAMSQQGSQGSQQYSQFGRYNQPGAPTESATPSQKSYDPFGNPTQPGSQYENFSSQAQTASQQQQQQQQQQAQQQQAQVQAQAQAQPQSGLGAYSSAPNDYPSYYTADQQRNAYQNYYNAYGQQGNTFTQQQASANQEAGANQQRSGSAFGSAPSDSAFPTSQAQQVPSRYGEAQNSGQNTPNPAVSGQTAPQSQGQHIHQQPHTQSGHNAGYGGYTHPYYQSPYYQNYINQYGGYGGQGFGPYGGKGSMYGQPHHGYGMSPQTPYDQHSSSPANAGGFGQSSMHGRDGLLGGGFGDYGRSSSTQPSSAAGNAAFGAMSDPFGRQQSGFPGQSQPYGQQQSGQQTASEDALKPFGDSKTSAGPSPSLGQPGRPGSATNNASGQANQSGLPPAQSHQQGFSGYPSHLGGQGNQYGGLGGLGSHQTGPQSYQAGGYGYGGGFGGNHYGRGGWGANFSGHQNH